MKHMSVAAALIIAMCAAPLHAQVGTTTEAEMRRARADLEAAAREVARLAGDYSGPAVDFVRELGSMGRGAVLGIGIEDNEAGVTVVGVTPGGGADEAGIETGDLIVAMDGAELGAAEGRSPSGVLIAQMDNVDPGDTVRLTVRRDGTDREVAVEAQPSRAQRYAFDMPRGRRDGAMHAGPRFLFNRPFGLWVDMELVELTPELGAYFGTEEGVLVVRAPSDDTLPLQDGDVILDIGGRTPTGTGHAMRILASFEPGESLELRIMRERREQTLEVAIPDAGRGG